MPTKNSVAGTAHADAQRHRILDAAERRFIEQGFHPATMASIAEQAGISAGLIYRYFDSKQAIILAIIERDLRGNREALNRMELSADLVKALAHAHDLWRRGDPGIWHVALFAEATAEAGRDPEIAQAVRDSDRAGREALIEWMLRRKQARDAKAPETVRATQARALLLQCLAEGLAIHALREPDLDPQLLDEMLSLVVPVILPD